MSDFITNGELRMEAERLCDENERLAADNARLRELAETYGMIANDRVLDYFERDEMLEAANATARELVVEL